MSTLCKSLHNRLKKNPPAWTNEHTKIVQQIKKQVKGLPCLQLVDPTAFKIVETDASDIGYCWFVIPSLICFDDFYNWLENIVHFYSIWKLQLRYQKLLFTVLPLINILDKSNF